MFFTILKEELLQSRKNYGRIIQNFLFFCISFAVFFFASSIFAAEISAQTALIYNSWLCLLFNIIFVNSSFLKEEADDGVLEQMLIKFYNFEFFILAKILGNWLIFSLPILLAIPLFAFLFGLDKKFIFGLFILTILASLTINSIAAFSGSLNLFGGKTSLIAIIVMPLILPVLLISLRGIVDFTAQESFYPNLKLLFALVILSAVFTCFFTAKIVKIYFE